jgi:muconolactone delta-isomerase
VRTAALGVLTTVCLLAAMTDKTSARPIAPACGRELWDLKTFSDPRRNLVYLRPVQTTVAAINAKRAPRRTPLLRARGFERHVWRVIGEITEYRLAADGDIHIVLFDQGDYMIAEMPSTACLRPTTRDSRAIINARTFFEQRCGAATGQWRTLGAVAELEGVGFWDFPHGQAGHAKNYAELHPVTHIRLIAGCQ